MRQPPPDVIAAAQAADRARGVSAAVSLGQWALESGWGEHMPPGSNNPFGIKARPGDRFVTAPTREVLHGVSVVLPQRFRVFASLAEAFDLHAALLATGGAYAKARGYLHHDGRAADDAFADDLTGTYATDPQYGRLLRQLMTSEDLYRFDAPDPAPPAGDVVSEAVRGAWAASIDRARAECGA